MLECLSVRQMLTSTCHSFNIKYILI